MKNSDKKPVQPEKAKAAFGHRVNIYMTPETKRTLERKAEKRRLSLSQLIREAIEAF